MSRTRVVLADDHAILREGLRGLINSQPDLIVVAEAANGPDAVERVRETGPRVLCLDLSMPGWGGVSTIERVKEASPVTRVLVLTMHDDPAYVRVAMTAGADGYVLKTEPAGVLLAAIREVTTGQQVISASLRGYLSTDAGPAAKAPSSRLSQREGEILELLARGHTHQEIAERLFLSIKSVETYRARVKEKTGLKTRADFVRYGLESGLLARPPEGGPPGTEPDGPPAK